VALVTTCGGRHFEASTNVVLSTSARLMLTCESLTNVTEEEEL
jgi:hypothetical protein